MSDQSANALQAAMLLSDFFNLIRANGTNLKGSNKQLTLLIADALDHLSAANIPGTASTQASDTERLARELNALAESFGGEGLY